MAEIRNKRCAHENLPHQCRTPDIKIEVLVLPINFPRVQNYTGTAKTSLLSSEFAFIAGEI